MLNSYCTSNNSPMSGWFKTSLTWMHNYCVHAVAISSRYLAARWFNSLGRTRLTRFEYHWSILSSILWCRIRSPLSSLLPLPSPAVFSKPQTRQFALTISLQSVNQLWQPDVSANECSTIPMPLLQTILSQCDARDSQSRVSRKYFTLIRLAG